MRTCAGLVCCLLVIVSTTACSNSTTVSESVVSSSLAWLDELRTQVNSNDYVNAMNTVKKIDEQGTVDATLIAEYYALKAKAEIGSGNLAAARLTIDELERGSEEPAVVHVLRGELALKDGQPSIAKEEFSKARSIDPKIVIPRM